MTEDSITSTIKDWSITRGFLKHPLVYLALLGLIIRIVLGLLLTYNFDVSHWATVMENIRSGNGLYELDGYYYSPPWGYILAFISSIGDLLGVGDFGARVLDALSVEQFTEWHFTATLTTLSFNILVKMPLFICDIAVAYVIRWIVLERTEDIKKANYGFAIWIMCPLVIVISSINGMFDTISVLMVLLCVVFLMKDNCFMAGMMFGLAVLTKFFPIFLIFMLIAYVLVKHKDDGMAIKKLGVSLIGAVLIILIVLLPNILDGNVLEAFSFITNRASSGLDSGLGVFDRYGTILAYVAFILASIWISFAFYKGKFGKGPLDHRFMLFLFVNLAVLFLYPSTPQYILLLLPFLIYLAITVDRRFWLSFVMIAFGSTMFAISCNFTLLLSLGAFTDIISVGTLMPLIDVFQIPMFMGMSWMEMIYYLGGITQYLATIYIFYVLYDRRRTQQRGKHSKCDVPDTVDQ